jgi:2-succinyl-5-enolpyruvyl-6-hydroxy-3-cyclohexene-1-carboxylate synthase
MQFSAEAMGIEVHSVIDERGAAFLALGCAKRADVPAVAICTSGTAAGNFLPAVMEAHHANVPLIVITADRPLELLHSGANQTTDQRKLFVNHARFDTEFSLGAGVFEQERMTKECRELFLLGQRLVLESLEGGAGPVHLNLRLSEPLLPPAADSKVLADFLNNGLPPLLPALSSPRPGVLWPAEVDRNLLEEAIRSAERPVLLLGSDARGVDSKLLEWFRARNIVVLAEPAAGIGVSGVFPAEVILDKMGGPSLAAPDLILRLGGPITGRGLERAIAKGLFGSPKGGALYVILEEPGLCRNPEGVSALVLQAHRSCWKGLFTQLKVDRKSEDFFRACEESIQHRESLLEAHLDSIEELSEWHFHRWLSKSLPPEHRVFLGNSMPIRDWNSVAAPQPALRAVASNRGLSGIDGLLASAVGVTLSGKTPLHLVIGDLSFLHDLPSLLLRGLVRERPLVLWLLNNEGGEIFRNVGTAKAPGNTEWYTTPQTFDASALAKAFGWPFFRVQERAALTQIDLASIVEPSLIEVMINPRVNERARYFDR